MATASSAFAGVALFKDLDPKQLEHLERVAHRVHFEPGRAIVSEGEGGIAFFVISRGRVRVSHRVADGQEHDVRMLGSGDSFGEMALFADLPRSATVTAVEPTECLALHRFEFLDVLRKNPEIAIRLLRVLSERLLAADHRQ